MGYGKVRYAERVAGAERNRIYLNSYPAIGTAANAPGNQCQGRSVEEPSETSGIAAQLGKNASRAGSSQKQWLY
jgi:hypothetical protein